MVSQEELTKKIKDSFPDAEVKANDLTGGGDHWQVTIASKQFAGLSMIEQHQLVYKSLGDWVKKDIHALTLNTEAL